MARLLTVLSFAALAAARASPQAKAGHVSKVQVLESEVTAWKGKAASLQDDKAALLKTVQQVLRTNQTDVMERRLADMTRLKASVEQRCAQERADLEKKMKSTEEKCAASQEVVQSLKEQSLDWQTMVQQLKAENAALKKKSEALAFDKEHLMQAMHKLLRQGGEYAAKPDCACKQAFTLAEPAKAQAPHSKRSSAKPQQATNSTHAAVNASASPAAAQGRRLRAHASKPAAPSMEDPIAYMGDTSAITAYAARARAAASVGDVSAAVLPEDVEEAAAPPAPRPAPKRRGEKPPAGPRKLLRWLDSDDTARPAAAQADDLETSALDELDPEAAQRRKAAQAAKRAAEAEDADDEVDGVQDLLHQAEAALGSSSGDSSSVAAEPEEMP